MNITELEKIIDQYGADILRFCRTVSDNRYDADDLYQDTLLIAIQKLEKLDGQKNVKSYMLSIAVNLCKSKKRRNAIHNRIANQESFESFSEKGWDPEADWQSDPANIFLRQETLELIRKAVSELPQKYRIPICLFYSSNMSIAEISDCMKLPQGSVKSRLHRGKTMIRNQLEVAGYER